MSSEPLADGGGPKRRRRRLLLVMGALFAFYFGWALLRDIRKSLDFTPQGWQHPDSTNGVELTDRQRMLPDFMRRYKLDGMPRDSVLALLGEPNREGYFREWDLVYWLGPQQGYMAMDSEWLVIRFDSTGRVSQHAITHD